jgi:hypothetical protein
MVHTLQQLTIIEAPNFLISDILRPQHICWEYWFIFLKKSTVIKVFIMVGSSWRWISINLVYLLYIGFDYDLQLTLQ